MESRTDIDNKASELMALMHKHMGIKARNLEHAVARAGRRLPRPIRQQADEILDAQQKMQHPKLRQRVDLGRLDIAYREVGKHLRSIDRADLRRGRMLSVLGGIAFNLILVAVGFVLWLRWQGYV